ncbi:MAG: ribosome silencing factor [Candidatus Omnitrophica bacterium]|nr:ribosome silencing factor [Candidatus Omnitrophota bacterium]
MEFDKKVRAICEAGIDRKAEDVLVLDMSHKSTICDTFVVMSATSSVRVKAIVDAVEESLGKKGFSAFHREGYAEGSWALLDYGDVVVHVFYHETRKFYNLENLWGDAPRRRFVK